MSNYTKDKIEYERLKADVLGKQLPYMVVGLNEIRDVGPASNSSEHVLSVRGQEFLAPRSVMDTVDRKAGLLQTQKKSVFQAGGNESVRDLRNYLSSAKSISKRAQYVLYANPGSRRIDRILPVLGSVISLEAFFRLAEKFMDENNLLPEAFEIGYPYSGTITLRMATTVPDIRSFREGEDMELTGFYMRWYGNRIELGLYALRLVCSNGQTVQLGRSSNYEITNLDPQAVSNLLRIPQNKNFIDCSIDRFQRNAELAIATPASMKELHDVSDMLTEIGVPEETVKRIAPYEADLDAYKKQKIELSDKRRLISSVNTWKLYNGITAFATHNTIWETNDIKRDILRQNAMSFLDKPRDIKTYLNIFK